MAADEGETGRAVLEPVVVPRPAAMLADVLREKILRGEIPEGSLLPAERTLVEQSRLSRSVVREALSILKQQGLVTSRPGRTGGTVVTRPSFADLHSSIEVYIAAQGWDSGSPALTDIREVVEPWCAALAAARRVPGDLAVLEERLREMEQATGAVNHYVAASLAWHFAVADASHNVLLAALMRARTQDLVSAADHARYDDEAKRRATVDTHAAITAAIAAADARTAYALMEEHTRTGPGTLLDRLAGPS